MVRQRRTIGSDTKALPESSTDKPRDATSVKTAATISPTENETATVAYQLWRERGCPIGSDQEDWFRAEAILKNPLVVNGEDRFRLFGERQGYWMIWEREWACAIWVWDVLDSGAELSNHAYSSAMAA